MLFLRLSRPATASRMRRGDEEEVRMALIRHRRTSGPACCSSRSASPRSSSARNYALGTAARMGPGYFPRILGLLLIGLGAHPRAARAARVRRRDAARGKWRPTLIVLGSVVLFGLIVDDARAGRSRRSC